MPRGAREWIKKKNPILLNCILSFVPTSRIYPKLICWIGPETYLKRRDYYPWSVWFAVTKSSKVGVGYERFDRTAYSMSAYSTYTVFTSNLVLQ